MRHLEERAKEIRARRRLRRLFWLLLLVGAVAAGVYWRQPLWNFYQEARRALNPPEVEQILKEQRREGFGIYCIGPEQPSDCYLFDKEGIILGKAKAVVSEVLLRLEEVSDYQPRPGQTFYNQQRDNLLKILDFSKNYKLRAVSYQLKREEQELKARLENGPWLFFSLRFDPGDHLAALKILMERSGWSGLQYVDLRTEKRVFYK